MPKMPISLEAVAEWFNENFSGFDSDVEIDGDTVRWTGRDGVTDEPTQELVGAARKAVKSLKEAFPGNNFQISLDDMDEWINIVVRIPGAVAAPKVPDPPKYVSIPEKIAHAISRGPSGFQFRTADSSEAVLESGFGKTLDLGPDVGRCYPYFRIRSTYYNYDGSKQTVSFDFSLSCPYNTIKENPFFWYRERYMMEHRGSDEDIQEAAAFFNDKVWPYIKSEVEAYAAKTKGPASPGSGVRSSLHSHVRGRDSYKRSLMNRSIIKASASFAEVEEVLKAFLARHPEVAGDSSINRGSIGDSILAGAIATMTFEGEGSLYDTMNYGENKGINHQAIIKDLMDSLKGIGCYYEQGHDWSLGVYPGDETSEEREERDLLDKMAQHLKVEPDDLTVDSTQDYGGGSVMTISHGNKTYYVGSSDALEAMAKDQIQDQISQDIESMRAGEDPNYFSTDTFEFYVDRDALLEFVRTSISEMENERVNELTTEEKKEWLDENDGEWTLKFKPADAGDDWEPSDEDVEKAFGYGEDWVEAQVDAQAKDWQSAWSWLEDMGPVGPTLVQNGLIDETWMAEQTLRDGGISEALGGELYEDSDLTYLEM